MTLYNMYNTNTTGERKPLSHAICCSNGFVRTKDRLFSDYYFALLISLHNIKVKVNKISNILKWIQLIPYKTLIVLSLSTETEIQGIRIIRQKRLTRFWNYWIVYPWILSQYTEQKELNDLVLNSINSKQNC